MMKLLVDCHVFDGKFQGTRTFLQGLYQQMIKNRDIDFYFAAQNTKNLETYFGCDEHIHYVRLKSGGSLMRLMFEFPKIIKENSIDYAHFQYVSPLMKNCKEIVTIHDLLFLDYPEYFSLKYRVKNKIFFSRSAKRADILLTVSDYSRNAISRHFGIPISSIYITPNAVLSADLLPNRIDVKAKYGLDKYILTVSRIEPRKNHLALLKAFVELKLFEKGYKLFFVGVPDLAYDAFKQYYSKLLQRVKDNIVFKSVSYPDLVELYRNASLFVFPSFAEGFGIPPLEAIENGCPVLCSNTTAMSEFNLPQELLFNPKDESDLQKKILRLLKLPPDMSKIKQCLDARFNWNRIAADFYKILNLNKERTNI